MINVIISTGMGPASAITTFATEYDTVAHILEVNNIDYGRATLSVAGGILGPGDADKPLNAWGYTDGDRVTITAFVKADNAAKVSVVAGSYVIESSMSLEELQTLNKYKPEALMHLRELDNGGKKCDFRICLGAGHGMMTNDMMVFGEYENNGKACVMATVFDAENPEEAFADEYGKQFAKFLEIEEGFAAALEEANQERAKILATFEHTEETTEA